MKSSILVLAALSLGLSGLQAQTAPAVKVKVSAPKVINIQTPQFQAGNTPNRNWRPKEWLEFDTELQITLPPAAGGRNGSLSSMTVNYYVALNAQTKDNKYHLLKGTINYVDVPAGERCHALAYITPSTLRRILEKDQFTAASDVKASAIEIVVDGQVVGGETSIPGKWWEKTDAFEATENVVLPRKETPFDILWGDYDLPTKSK
ncbi:Amuc_1102 family pilus-like protein [Brevifollis gellanilyticus]|uniref:Uncharacterized protein n=1 Tax=Brevifollis gellanilyticus TaxID=748831 RepID=A0A512M9A8_9BACT|nr:Amuc_1102 family pilus-like protein [Brevifollis gellanilyticus]GEP43320.1 hypothetical protein BGE01nite_26110 [Brevifollis gellanilyticus]